MSIHTMSVARQGSAVAILMATAGAVVSAVSGVSLGFAPVIFLVSSVVPWGSVLYLESRQQRVGQGEFDPEWGASVTALISGFLGLFSLSGLIGYSGGVAVPSDPSNLGYPGAFRLYPPDWMGIPRLFSLRYGARQRSFAPLSRLSEGRNNRRERSIPDNGPVLLGNALGCFGHS